jgi:hypothetical protein
MVVPAAAAAACSCSRAVKSRRLGVCSLVICMRTHMILEASACTVVVLLALRPWVALVLLLQLLRCKVLYIRLVEKTCSYCANDTCLVCRVLW